MKPKAELPSIGSSGHLAAAISPAMAQSVDQEYSSAELAALGAMKFSLPLIEHLELSGHLNPATMQAVELAFQEALVNALDHGNLELNSKWREEIDAKGADRYTAIRRERLQDPHFANRKIYIHAELCDRTLEIAIQNEGPGFIPESKSSTPCSLGTVKCYGRGMAIMVAAMDQVVYTDRGTRVVLRKNLGT